MTWFSKPKGGQSTEPELCRRCGKRAGTARLYFVAAAGITLDAAEREAWICDECQAGGRSTASSN
jgi:hypothetical protein